jgi:hypothetical protein
MEAIDRDGPVLWAGQLPMPLAYHFFCEDMREKYGDFSLPEVQYYMVCSALARGDRRSAEIYVSDYLAMSKKPTVKISKFSPGEHFYVFREKFDSYEEARKHAEGRGYRVLPGIDVQSMNDLLLAARAAKRDRGTE